MRLCRLYRPVELCNLLKEGVNEEEVDSSVVDESKDQGKDLTLRSGVGGFGH